jgi:hypothetical protein
VFDFYGLYHKGFGADCSGQDDAANARICVISVISGGVYRELAEAHHGSSPLPDLRTLQYQPECSADLFIWGFLPLLRKQDQVSFHILASWRLAPL